MSEDVHPDARVVVSIAAHEASARGHGTIELTHLLLAVVLDPRGRRALESSGCRAALLRRCAEQVVRSADRETVATGYSYEAQLVMARASDRGGHVLDVLRAMTLQPSLRQLFVTAGASLGRLDDPELAAALHEVPTPSFALVNDDVTPFDLVTDALQRIAGLDASEATALAIAVDARGREHWVVETDDRAIELAHLLEAHARANGFPLVVRPNVAL